MFNENKFDEYTKMEEHQGKAHLDLPPEIRVALYQQLAPEEYRQFKLGRADENVLKKAQTIYDNCYNEKHPTDIDLYNRRRQAETRDNIENLTRQLKIAKDNLAKLDHDAKMDKPLPFGSRERLRKEIAQIETQLKTQNVFKDDSTGSTGSLESDWLDSFFTE